MSEQPDIMWFGEEPIPEKAKWWGITTGSLTYASYAVTAKQALENVATDIGVPVESLVVPIIEQHEDKYQAEISSRYQERHVVRVIPFSMIEWPADINNTTPEQEEALTQIWGPRPKPE